MKKMEKLKGKKARRCFILTSKVRFEHLDPNPDKYSEHGSGSISSNMQPDIGIFPFSYCRNAGMGFPSQINGTQL
jgi:hypothetical protein